MALSIVNVATFDGASTTNPSFSYTPAAAGNLIVFIFTPGRSRTITVDTANATVIDTDAIGDGKTYFYQTADTSAVTQSWTLSGGAAWRAEIYEISGHDPVTPINAHGESGHNGGTITVYTTPSVTPTVLGCLPLAFFTTNGLADTWTSFSANGTTITADRQDTGTHYNACALHGTLTADTTTAVNVTATYSATGSGQAMHAIVLVAPAPATSSPVATPTTLTFVDPASTTQTVAISGGTAPYSTTVATTNAAVATAVLASSTVTVTPHGPGTCTLTVTDNAAQTCTITITVGAAMSLSATSLAFTDPKSAAQTSTISNGRSTYTAVSGTPAVATVTVAGTTVTVTPVTAGSATITVTDADSESATIAVTVGAAMSLSPTSLAFTDPKSAAKTSAISGGRATFTGSSSAPAIATVAVVGTTVTVTPVAVGSCTITITDADSETATIAVTVGAVMTLSPTNLSFTDPGSANKTSTITGGRSVFTGSSSATGVATVTVSGTTVTVNPVAQGSATITITDADGETATIGVTVGAALSLSLSSLSFASSGAAAQTSTASGGRAAYSANSSATAIATVTVAGSVVTVTPHAAGSCTITVTDADGETATIAVTVAGVAALSATPAGLTFFSTSAPAQTISVSGGTAPYFASGVSGIVSVAVAGGVVTVTPINPGNGMVVITDSASGTANVSISVAGGSGSSQLFPTKLGHRQLIQIYDPANTSDSFTPSNNPTTQAFKPETVRKYVRTTNGTSIISGDKEYPPSEISLNWDFIDYSGVNAMRMFTAISPVVLVDNNDNGFLGIFCIDDAAQVPGKTSNVWAIKSSFLVLNPYNGNLSTVNQLVPPTLTTSAATTGGAIPASTTLYFWSTVFTQYGESVISAVKSQATAAGTATNTITVNFTANPSIYYRKTRLYWNTINDPTSSTMLTEIMAGQTPSFIVGGNYAEYNQEVPPSYGQAFQGLWASGLWLNDSR